MSSKSFLLYLKSSLLLLTLVSCATAYTVNNSEESTSQTEKPINKEPGKCYAKALIPTTHRSAEKKYPVYKGPNVYLLILFICLAACLVNK